MTVTGWRVCFSAKRNRKQLTTTKRLGTNRLHYIPLGTPDSVWLYYTRSLSGGKIVSVTSHCFDVHYLTCLNGWSVKVCLKSSNSLSPILTDRTVMFWISLSMKVTYCFTSLEQQVSPVEGFLIILNQFSKWACYPPSAISTPEESLANRHLRPKEWRCRIWTASLDTQLA